MSFQSFKPGILFRRLTVLSVLSTILILLRFQTWQSEQTDRNKDAVDLPFVSLQEHFAFQAEIDDRAVVYRHSEKKRGQQEEEEEEEEEQQQQHILATPPAKGKHHHHRPAHVEEDKVFKLDSDTQYLAPITASTQYLTYTPHSGFHNQRIALMNALELAALLNRTLLIPPMVLGDPIHWREADVLEDWHRHLSKARPTRCVRPPARDGRSKPSSRCQKKTQYTSLHWDRLFDLRALKRRIAIQYRDDYEPAYLERHFGLTDNDIFRIKDTTLYDYRISDTDTRTRNGGSLLGKYQRELVLDDLRSRPERLIQFGSLFGTGRIITRTTVNGELHDFIEAQFVLSRGGSNTTTTNTVSSLFDVAETIIDQLGGPGRFLSVHARLGDSMFERYSEKVMAKLLADLQAHVPKEQPTATAMSAQACLDAIQKNEPVDGQVLFMATDVPQPRTLPLFQPIFDTFPCVITLEDVFDYARSPLTTIVNPEDGVAYGRFLIPFVDGLVASRGREFTGSMWSTFSGYIQFLHREYKRDATAAGLNVLK